MSEHPVRRVAGAGALSVASVILMLSLAACGGGGEPSQQDVQTALSASNELPPGDSTLQVEILRCGPAPDDKQAYLCKYRFPPADPIEGIFKKSAGVWRHVGG